MTRPVRAAAARARAATRQNERVSRSGSASVSDSEVSVVVISDSDDDDAFDPTRGRVSGPGSGSPSPSITSIHTLSDSEPEESGGKRGTKRKRPVKRVTGKSKVNTKAKVKISADGEIPDLEDCVDCVAREHGPEYHSIDAIVGAQDALLQWFEGVRDERGMPWRKRYDASASPEAKAQRAYEVWVSEVMLQQTQVSTVIDYWSRWVARWPTIADLARADIEEVNAAWRGLGYYRRAKSLLEGAKTVMGKKSYGGRLPSDPDELEKGIPGVGRYTAGAICSIAYGVRTPIVDGNIHRVLTRLLAVHATQTAPGTTRFLWETAEALVDALPKGLARGIAGDWNQALMELGATVCRPVNPDCGACPLEHACKARLEASTPPPPPKTSQCTLCEPLPPPLEVTSFPMKKVKKASREENEVVVVTEWRSGDERRWLLSKRPEKGLLAGLFEPPTIAIAAALSPTLQLQAGQKHVASLLGEVDVQTHEGIAAVPHIFSHINMTYHAQHLVVTSPSDRPPPLGSSRLMWLDASEVEAANVGTGVKKVWAAVYGRWGAFERAAAAAAATSARGGTRNGGGGHTQKRKKM